MNIFMLFFGYSAFLILSLLATQAFIGAFESEQKIYVIRIDEQAEANVELYLLMFLWFSIGYFSHLIPKLLKKY